jgi:phosphopantothenoylcysteine decarboxylase/phosphopantothenate--cysteine ligase
MGFDIARSAANLGASILVAGPTHLTVSHSLVQVIPVVTAARNVRSMSSVFR